MELPLNMLKDFSAGVTKAFYSHGADLTGTWPPSLLILDEERGTERCCWHQDVGRGGVEGHLQEDEGSGSPEGGHVLEGSAVQPRG